MTAGLLGPIQEPDDDAIGPSLQQVEASAAETQAIEEQLVARVEPEFSWPTEGRDLRSPFH